MTASSGFPDSLSYPARRSSGTQPGADFGFFARYDPEATRLDQLRPAFGEERFFFEGEYASMLPAA
nr:hypothetical protein [Thioalkalivibrio sp.]